MDKTKSAISDFMAKAGHHDTTVHETVAPAVQHEVVKPHMHEELNTAIDKEIHQDHYHRTVQPVRDREVIPEQHSHNFGTVQHKEFDHRDHEQTRRALAAEQQQFASDRIVEPTTKTQSSNAAIAGEHVHHHIHETIQPVLKKEVIQPNVVHTTVPIHEVHHNAAQHHSTSELPPVSLDEFKQKGGVLGGREERYDAFKGEPKNIGGAHTGTGGSHHSGLTGAAVGAMGAGAMGAGAHHSNLANKADPRVKSSRSSSSSSSDYEQDGTTRRKLKSKTGQAALGSSGGPVGGVTHRPEERVAGHHNTTESAKPSLLEKLNPMVDSTGDGKAGFMK